MSEKLDLVVATSNPKKGIEMQTILGDAGWNIRTLAEFPEADQDVEETGTTFAENSEIKARSAASATGKVCIADDGGLCIDFLDGQPGVYSKRFLGENVDFPEKMARILELMKDVPYEKRTCRFQCLVTICTPENRTFQVSGVCEGHIGYEMKGNYGFGYDPLVVVDALQQHMAELPPSVKHAISHRGSALAQAKIVLNELIKEFK